MQSVRRDEVTLRTTCIKNVKFKIIKKDSLSVFSILLLQRNLNWAARNLRLDRGLDIADLDCGNLPKFFQFMETFLTSPKFE